MIELFVCDHAERTGDYRQPHGKVIVPWVCAPDEEPGQSYADFRVLYKIWKMGPGDIVGFMGYRKYIIFDDVFPDTASKQAVVTKTAGWWSADRPTFNAYREALATWDGAEILPLLATHDIIVTPPFDVSYNGDLMMDFATSRSHKDAFAFNRALRARGVETISKKIYPYIFVTRWSVFDRFMEFAWPLAQELEPLCKGEDSLNAAYKKRPMAYILERAFSLWLENSKLSYIELPLINCWEL